MVVRAVEQRITAGRWKRGEGAKRFLPNITFLLCMFLNASGKTAGAGQVVGARRGAVIKLFISICKIQEERDACGGLNMEMCVFTTFSSWLGCNQKYLGIGLSSHLHESGFGQYLSR